jgi:hypothetical protein
MATKSEIQKQIDALTKELESAPDDAGGGDVELWVKDEHGRETKLTGAHAKKWLKNLGLEDDEPAGGEGDSAEGDPANGDPPPAGSESVWGRKK